MVLDFVSQFFKSIQGGKVHRKKTIWCVCYGSERKRVEKSVSNQGEEVNFFETLILRKCNTNKDGAQCLAILKKVKGMNKKKKGEFAFSHHSFTAFKFTSQLVREPSVTSTMSFKRSF